MKKLLVVLVSLSLVSNGSLYSMARFKESAKEKVSKVGRHWRCLTKPKEFGCSAEERKKARKWLIYTPTAVIVSLLAAAGIVATSAYIAQKKKERTIVEDAIVSEQKKVDKVMNNFNIPAERKNILLAFAKAQALKGVEDVVVIKEYKDARQDAFESLNLLLIQNVASEELTKIYSAIFTLIFEHKPSENVDTWLSLHHYFYPRYFPD